MSIIFDDSISDESNINSNSGRASSSNDTMILGLTGQFVFWLVFSFVSALIFAKYSRNLCQYLFTTMAWTYIWILFTQSWNTMERDPKDIGMLVAAGILGWGIGTSLIWKNRDWRNTFLD